MRLLGLGRKSKSSSSSTTSTTATTDDAASTRASTSRSLYKPTASASPHQQDFGHHRLHPDDDLTSTKTHSTAPPPPRPSYDARSHTSSASSSSTLGKRSFFKRARSKSNATLIGDDQHDHPQLLPKSNSSPNGLAFSVTRPSIDTSLPQPHPLRTQTFGDEKDARDPSASPASRRSVFGFVARRKSSFGPPTATAEESLAAPSETVIKHKRSQPSLSGIVRPALKPKQTDPEIGSSFQLHSFRLATAGAQPPPSAAPVTLSALVQDEVAASPLLSEHGDVFTASPTTSRPQSPVTFDAAHSDDGHGRPVRPRQASGSGSITVAKFREAKAARSTSSLHSNSSNTPYSGGLGLDLPPRLSLDPNRRSASFNSLYGMQDAIQEVVARVSEAPVSTNTPSYALPSPPSETRSGFVVESRRGIFPTATAPTSPYSPPSASRSPLGRSAMSDIGHGSSAAAIPSNTPYYLRSRRLSSASVASSGSNMHRVSMALHPDVALPLPPIPVDPSKRTSTVGGVATAAAGSPPPFLAGNSRRTSVQSVSSVASVFGSWLSAQSANIGLATAVEEVAKIVAPATAASPPRPASVVQTPTTSPVQKHVEQQKQRTRTLSTASETAPTLRTTTTPALSRQRSGTKQSTASSEQEVLAFPSSHGLVGPTKVSTAQIGDLRQEDLDVLLGGKILPAPPSAMQDDMSITSCSANTLSTLAHAGGGTGRAASSQTSVPSRSSSMNATMEKVKSAANLFTTGLSRLAKPAKEDSEDDDDDGDSDNEKPVGKAQAQAQTSAYATARATPVDTQSRGASQVDLPAIARKPVAAKDLFGGSDSDSDDSSGEDVNNSDDSATKARKIQKSRVAPPPRSASRVSNVAAQSFRVPSPAIPPAHPYSSANTAYSSARASPVPSTSAIPAASATLRPLPAQRPVSSAALLQPTVQRSALTTQALRNLTGTGNDDDDDEETPLTVVAQKRGAMSEFGIGHRSAFGMSSARSAYGIGNTVANSSIGVNRRPQQAASSIGMQHRSMSGLSTTSSHNALQPLGMQRSLSAQAVPTLGSSGPPSVTLSSLIAAEMAGDRHTYNSRGATSQLMPQPRRPSPSSSIGSSMLKTPSDLSTGFASGKDHVFIAENVPLSQPSLRLDHRAAMSEAGLRIPNGMPSGKAASTMSTRKTHSKTQSVPLAQLEGNDAHNRMKARHREEALKNAMDGRQNLQGHASADLYQGPMPMLPSLAPLPLHGMSCPPGVDPLLYASLPTDQKLALQQRSQQMLAMMQSYAMQASAGTGWQAPQQGMPMTSMPFNPYMQMQAFPQSNMNPALQMPQGSASVLGLPSHQCSPGNENQDHEHE